MTICLFLRPWRLRQGTGGSPLIAAALGCLLALLSDTGVSQALDTRRICIATDSSLRYLQVEIADSPQLHSQGLMGRTHLGADAGMLFVYPEDQRAGMGFWMFRTLIPLDIAFLDTRGRITTLHSMQPCGAEDHRDCPRYPALAPFRYALEVNLGYFDRHRIRVGDRVNLEPAARCD